MRFPEFAILNGESKITAEVPATCPVAGFGIKVHCLPLAMHLYTGCEIVEQGHGRPIVFHFNDLAGNNLQENNCFHNGNVAETRKPE